MLTAAHVIVDAESILAVFNADLPDEWSALARVRLCLRAGDVAILTIDPPDEHSDVEAARFGRLGRRAAEVAFCAVGFPRFKLRVAPLDGELSPAPYRDAYQAGGSIPSLSNWREGTLEMNVVPPSAGPDPMVSPWEGMSGAAVWCNGRIVGIVSRHDPDEGLNRLTAVRVAGWYECMDSRELGELRELVGLPAAAEQLVDVIPGEPERLLAEAYTAYLADIAPTTLHGRTQELAELAAFCMGEEFYSWWQAGPWAGKTALTSWFALHPPVGITVVSFFVSRRLPGQADNNAFTTAVVDQLAEMAGEPRSHPGSAAAREGQRQRLIRKVAMQAAVDGRRLLLLVDGLDEDEGVHSGAGSIAALLPRRPVEGLRVLVTSRPYSDLPRDLPADHPLWQFDDDHRRSRYRPRILKPSQLGEQLRVLASGELDRLLQVADEPTNDIIGYIAAAGGGLTIGEIGELTNSRFVDLRARLRGAFARSLRTQRQTDVFSQPAEPVYLFAHETLRELADEHLGYDLEHYRGNIHRWAASYRQRGWPENTPRFLWRSYSQMLARTRDVPRLVELIIEPTRHDRMLASTLVDDDALLETSEAQQLLLAAARSDLSSLALLAVERYRLSLRNSLLPSNLPALWVHFGRSDRAEQLARAIEAKHYRSPLCEVVHTMAETGQLARAEKLARTISDPGRQALALAGVALAQVRMEQFERAGQMAIAAEQLATDSTIRSHHLDTLTTLAQVWAEAGQLDRSEQVVGLLDVVEKVKVLAKVVESLAKARQLQRAEQVALVAEQLAHSSTGPDTEVRALAELVKAHAAAGQVERAEQTALAAEQLARAATDIDGVVTAMAQVSHVWAALEQVDRAKQSAMAAEHLTRSLTPSFGRSVTLIEIAETWARIGQVEQAENVISDVQPQGMRNHGLASVALTLVQTGDLENAERVARIITSQFERMKTLSEVAQAMAETDQTDHAERLASTITDPEHRANALVTIAKAWVRAGELARAEQLARTAEQLARTVTGSSEQAREFAAVIAALGEAGQAKLAERLANTITDEDERQRALADVATSWASIGRRERAEEVALALQDDHNKVRVLASLAKEWAAAGRLDRAGQLALITTQVVQAVRPGYSRRMALPELARAWAAAGRPNQAERVVEIVRRLPPNTWYGDKNANLEHAVDIAKTLAAAGQPEQAEQQARSITSEFQQTQLLTEVVRAWAEAGHLEQAERAAHTIIDEKCRVQALGEVAQAWGDAGQPERADLAVQAAERITSVITNQSVQASALTVVVEAWARLRQVDRAERIARAIVDADLQTWALFTLGHALVKQGIDPAQERTRPIAARILANSHFWYYALPLLASIDPAALALTGRAILALHGMSSASTDEALPGD